MLEFVPVWFDSFGAKSSCTLVKTDDVNVLIDPGVAIMHPTFPASLHQKLRWVEQGWKEVKKAAKEADVIVISHYHWDHFSPEDMEIYRGKLVLAKNPNMYINDSQRKRAMKFYERLWAYFGAKQLELEDPTGECFKPSGVGSEFLGKHGEHDKEKESMLKEAEKWFENRVKKWKNYGRVPETKFEDVEIRFAEGKTLAFGKTKLRFTPPLFHGAEYSRVGWIFMTTVECGKDKLVHSSDVDGPIIESYADLIIKENPRYLILDGPMTYMLGYALNNAELKRALLNACNIVEKISFEVMIWDHHLPREPRFRWHTKEVFELAEKLKKNVLTAREFRFNKKAVVEELANRDNI